MRDTTYLSAQAVESGEGCLPSADQVSCVICLEPSTSLSELWSSLAFFSLRLGTKIYVPGVTTLAIHHD